MADGKPGRPTNINWDKVERLFRAGVLSTVEIARQVGVDEAVIRMYAKRHGWKKDLTQEVRQLTRVKLVENLSQVFNNGEPPPADQKDEDIVEEAARTQVQVVRSHQYNSQYGHALTMRMLDELDMTTAYKGELQELISSTIAPKRQEAFRRAMSLQARAGIMKDLAAAARVWVTMERQAFNIVDDRDEKKDANIEQMSTDELRQEILKDAKQIGLDLTEEDLRAQGVLSKH